LADLAEAEWIRPTVSVHSSEVDFEGWFELRGLKRPNIALHTQSALVTLTAVASSDLLTILPQQWLEYPAMQSQIEAILVDDLPYQMPICIARRRDLPLTPMAEYFCDLVRRAGHSYGISGSSGS
jgi:DNA-binding transcriptional LysR family regulator